MGEGSGGFILEPARFPGRAPIDAYGNGGFRFADMSHRGSIVALPSGIESWAVLSPEDVSPESLRQILDEAGAIEVLLIGTGERLVPLAPPALSALREAGLVPDLMSTGAAVRTYNVLLSEGRAVAAGFIAVDLVR
ncbi:Mth938-like domain-containing protein [Faunimonas sp. B44]|uniref:Mth938-like domain-containing protein n=1 Tax=Faunimonas sp. B44 TaxID=3461493 RepID=UPI0040441D29